ncbi:MAG TPA: DoxX family protein [Phycisphaerae bacterium]|nr:DoxX family protein [Phycisphaerae bacterium]
MELLRKIIAGYHWVTRWAGPILLNVFLLSIRIVWGWGFFIAGKPKLADVAKFSGFFKSWGIPFPTANVYLVGTLELVGGLCLLAGFCSRPFALLLAGELCVAYLTPAHNDVFKPLFEDTNINPLVNSDPFWFIVACGFVLALGPGWFSVDAVLKRFVFGKGCCGVKVDSKSSEPALMQHPAVA